MALTCVGCTQCWNLSNTLPQQQHGLSLRCRPLFLISSFSSDPSLPVIQVCIVKQNKTLSSIHSVGIIPTHCCSSTIGFSLHDSLPFLISFFLIVGLFRSAQSTQKMCNITQMHSVGMIPTHCCNSSIYLCMVNKKSCSHTQMYSVGIIPTHCCCSIGL